MVRKISPPRCLWTEGTNKPPRQSPVCESISKAPVTFDAPILDSLVRGMGGWGNRGREKSTRYRAILLPLLGPFVLIGWVGERGGGGGGSFQGLYIAVIGSHLDAGS